MRDKDVSANEAKVIDSKSTVTFHFSLKLQSGELVDSNFDSKPATFTMGDGNLLEGFEQSLLGLREGQQSSIVIAAESAFGIANPDNIQCFKRREIEPLLTDNKDSILVPGLVLSFADAAKAELAGVVDRLDGDKVYINFNHPLAGKDIIFDIHILEILAATDKSNV